MEVSSQIGPFSIVPEWVLDRGLSPTALKLYIVMARFADWNTGMAFPSRETLGQRMSCSLKTIDRAVIELVNAECVAKISRGRYASALYKVFQTDPRGTKLSSEWTDLTPEQTDMSSEGTDLSSRLDMDDHLTITNEQEPLEQEPINYLEKPKRAHRLPEDWYPSDRLLAMFATKWPRVEREHEIDQFINYWHAEGRTKLDWDKAFQVWMGRAESRAKTQRSWQEDKRKTNSERNIENLRAKMALLANNEQKELESGQATSGAIIDFGLNLRSAKDI